MRNCTQHTYKQSPVLLETADLGSGQGLLFYFLIFAQKRAMLWVVLLKICRSNLINMKEEYTVNFEKAHHRKSHTAQRYVTPRPLVNDKSVQHIGFNLKTEVSVSFG